MNPRIRSVLPRFSIEPYHGAAGQMFDISLKALLESGTVPEYTRTTRDATFVGFRGGQFIFDQALLLREVSLFPSECTVELAGQEILTMAPHGPLLNLKVLLSWDPQPRLQVGFLIFFGLGVWTTGFHDSDPAQLSLGAFRKGAFDNMRDAPTWSGE